MTTSLDAAGADLDESTGFVVALDGFTGPLDLLLHLVREEQIDIGDIPVARIADQFLAAIHALGLNQAADYLEMAGRLIRLKVQLLLPRHGDDDQWEDPRAELVRRLLEYQQIKEIAHELARLAERRSLRHGRGYLPPPPELPPLPLVLDLMEVLGAVERVVTGIPSPMLHRVIARPLDVESAVLRIQALLLEAEEFDWRRAFGDHPTIVEVLSTLLALLELARRGICRVRQDLPFAPLVIAREHALPALATA
ncbi:MAG TPA: segregation/condensation protein A [Gemmatimonadales bacterium]|nr:segregation/condensation protein A [Gemmatimonadales bacterium]